APTFTVFSRPGCHLCEQLIEELLPFVRGRAEVRVIDIDDDSELVEAYSTRVPVLVFGEQELCHYHLDTAAVERTLASL
ncbi:MAG: glutaredoxin family protein, partial [Pseudomonadota bacterium]